MSRCVAILVAASVLLGTASPAQSSTTSVVINEIDCHANDWIEIVNRSSKAVDISNWMLSDQQANSVKASHRYVFPERTLIRSGRYLAVQQSGLNSAHLPFGVPCAGGQTVYLSRPSVGALYATVDAVLVPRVPAGASYGRYPTAAGRFGFTFGTKARANKSALPHLVSPRVIHCRTHVKCIRQLRGVNVANYALVNTSAGVSVSHTGLVVASIAAMGRRPAKIRMTGTYGTSVATITISTK